MSQPLHYRRSGVAPNVLHPWNPAERQAQADRVIARETRQHMPGTERSQAVAILSWGTAKRTPARAKKSA